MSHRISVSFLLFILSVASVLAPLASGQVLQIVAVGDDTQAASWALAAHAASLANNNYTIKGLTGAGNFFAAMQDVRGGIPLEEGRLWVVWDNTPLPKTKVWCFLTVPTVVAARGFYAAPRAQMDIDPAVVVTPGLNLLAPILPPDNAVGLPNAIYAAVANAVFDAAMIGETPAQALAETNALLTNPAAPPAAYGYGPGPWAFPIVSFWGPQLHFPVVFAIAGADPITGQALPASKLTPLKNSLVVPAVNATNLVGPGGIGFFIAAHHNVTSPCNSLPAGLTGFLNTTQLFGAPGAGNLLTVLLDDPLSASWFAMEDQAYGGGACGSQEVGVTPPGPPFDPLNLLTANLRQRVEGPDQAMAVEAITPDSLTYVSFTCRRAGAGTYISVAGQTPFPGPGWGNFPACPVATNAKYSLRTMQNLATDNPIPAPIHALIAPVKAIVGAQLNWQ